MSVREVDTTLKHLVQEPQSIRHVIGLSQVNWSCKHVNKLFYLTCCLTEYLYMKQHNNSQTCHLAFYPGWYHSKCTCNVAAANHDRKMD